MDDPTGDYVTLVVRLAAADGGWFLWVDDAASASSRVLPLVPATAVLRVWQARETGVLRGTVGLAGGAGEVPFQTNAKMARLLRAWLLPDRDDPE